MNFRIRVYHASETGMESPPSFLAAEEVLHNFAAECKSVRREYPGLCALDYENVLRITIQHLIGFNKDGTPDPKWLASQNPPRSDL